MINYFRICFIASILPSITTILLSCGGGGDIPTSNNPITTNPLSQTPSIPTVIVPVENSAPIASAGISRAYSIGQEAILDGTLSFDQNNDSLSHSWLLVEAPAGSTAAASLTGKDVKVRIDKPGIYTYALSVFDGKLKSTNQSLVTFRGRSEISIATSKRNIAIDIPQLKFPRATGAVALNDGGYLFYGHGSSPSNDYDIFLTKKTANLDSDTTFATNGTVILDISPKPGEPLYTGAPSSDKIESVQALPDGSLIISATSFLSGLASTSAWRRFLAKIDQQGNVDLKFGRNGYIQLKDGIDGAILSEGPNGQLYAVTTDGVYLFNPNKLEATAIQKGALTPIYVPDLSTWNLSATSNQRGELFIVGEKHTSISARYSDYCKCIIGPSENRVGKLIRISAVTTETPLQQSTYTIESTFGDRGEAEKTLAIDAKGRVIRSYADGTSIYTKAFDVSGKLDTTFGNNGVSAFSTGSKFSSALKVITLPDGKIVVLGSEGESNNSIALRYNASGTLDTTFGINGALKVNFSRIDFFAFSDMIQKSSGDLVFIGISLDNFFMAQTDSTGALK